MLPPPFSEAFSLSVEVADVPLSISPPSLPRARRATCLLLAAGAAPASPALPTVAIDAVPPPLPPPPLGLGFPDTSGDFLFPFAVVGAATSAAAAAFDMVTALVARLVDFFVGETCFRACCLASFGGCCLASFGGCCLASFAACFRACGFACICTWASPDLPAAVPAVLGLTPLVLLGFEGRTSAGFATPRRIWVMDNSPGSE